MAAKVALISEQQIKDLSLIQLNVETKVLSRTILDTQTVYLKPILGNTLYDNVITEVQAKIANPSYTIPADIKTLLEDYIQPYLTHAVVCDLIINLTYRITNKGFLKYNDTLATSLSQDEVEYAKNFHDNRTSQFKANLVRHIIDEKLDGSTCGTDKDITTNSIGWFLVGNGFGCNGCNH